ncbi:hypothetical protein BBOR36S_04060 [Brevibacillus borstelensis]
MDKILPKEAALKVKRLPKDTIAVVIVIPSSLKRTAR